MAQYVTEEFRNSLLSSPQGKIKSGTMFDEIYGSMESSNAPFDQIIQMITEFHGPWSGSSTELFSFTSFLASLFPVPSLKQTASMTGKGACLVERAISISPPSSVGRQNTQTAAIMSTPLLREFVTLVQNIHPAINAYLNLHQEDFPYFQQTSENVGSFAYINLSQTETDPIKWGESGGIDCHSTNTNLDKNTVLKMNPVVANMVDTSNNLTNTLFLRSMRKNKNMALFHSNYSQERPINHGFNFTMDVFTGKRRINAIPNCLTAIINLAGDLLRLLNKYFCVREIARYETEEFKINQFATANNEPITFIVDNRNNLINNDEQATEQEDPTYAKAFNVDDKFKDESP